MKEIKSPVLKNLADYGLITISIWSMVIGVYFFKFQNNFSFGGVTGLAPAVSMLTPWSAGDFTFAVNMLLLAVGFVFLGSKVGIKTFYASFLMSFGLTALERLCPMEGTLTQEPLLELFFAILLPGIGTAVLFHIGASSGGTDVIAMVLKKYTSWNIGTSLLAVDITSVILSFLIFGPATGLFSSLGLIAKSQLIDSVIESMNLCKCFNIVCDNPDPICDYIINSLKRGATVYEAHGAFSHHNKTVIMTTMKRGQAIKLRNYIKSVEPGAFVLISNSSEIIGKGFLTC